MAYRAFDVGPFGLDTSWDMAMAGEPAITARFTPLEARVIALSTRDRIDTVRERSRGRRLLDALFGIRRSAPLADPKLETLRRFTILARLADGRLPEREIEQFLAAGYSPLQARALQLRAAAAHLFDK